MPADGVLVVLLRKLVRVESAPNTFFFIGLQDLILDIKLDLAVFAESQSVQIVKDHGCEESSTTCANNADSKVSTLVLACLRIPQSIRKSLNVVPSGVSLREDQLQRKL